MNNREMDAVIGELCGWEWKADANWPEKSPDSFYWRHASTPNPQQLPRFTEDLNACQMFKDHLSDREKEMYAEHLDNDDNHQIKDGDYIGWVEMPPFGAFQYATLPAIKHCKVFLRVKGKQVE